MSAAAESRTSIAYLFFILGISLLAILLLVISTLFHLSADTQTILEYADTTICILFFVDFLITLARSERKLKYLVTWGWLDLASSIPAVNAFRIGRLARTIRILRVLRGIRSGRVLASFILERRAQSAFLAAALLSLLLIVFGSVAILQFEHGPDANIKGPQDAVWWSIVTLTTVGYGDRFPITLEGRIIAAILMIAGVGLFGTLSGFVAAWFLAPAERQRESEIELLRREIQELRQITEERDKNTQV